MKKQILIIGLILILHTKVNAQSVELTPLYNTIGVKITNISSIDSCKLEYKTSTQNNWLLSYKLDRILINNIDQFRGSLFMLEQNTDYDIKVTVYSGQNENVLNIEKTKTLSTPLFLPTSNIKWVSPTGTGNYTQENPGNLESLFSTGQVVCGLTIILKDGVYSSNNLQLNLNNSCNENSPIIIMAEQGSNPVFDGSLTINTIWKPHVNDSNLYYTPTPAGTSHSNICMLGNVLLYPYPSLTANAALGNYNLSELNFGKDGFVRDENNIWIKTQTHINPNDSVIKVSKNHRFLTVYGNNNNAFLKVKGIKFKYYGKPVLNAIGSADDYYAAAVFDLRNVNHIYFDSCQFIYNTVPILFKDESHHFTIQNSFFKNEAGNWTHAMLKKSHYFLNNIFNSISSSRARAVENPNIFIQQGSSGVIRNNVFEGLNSGIESYIDQGLKEDIDINDNVFIDNFDAIECDGLWTNLRVWNNEIIRPMSGISAAPPLIGPRYFYRNVIHGMKGRSNVQDDPYFIGCSPIGDHYMGQGIGIKTNSGYTGNIAPGNLYFFNNTFHISDTLGFVMTSWESEWRKAVFINNSYSHTNSHPFFYFDLADNLTNSDFQLTSINDNYFTHSNSPIAKIKHIHGQFTCSEVNDVNNLENTMINISGSSSISIVNPSQIEPLFTSTNTRDFKLSNTSQLIDAGIKIPGFYDFKGLNPDIGAKEFNSSLGYNGNLNNRSEILLYPNPSNKFVNILFDFNINQQVNLLIYNQLGLLVKSQKMNVESKSNHTFSLEGLCPGVYFVLIPELGFAKQLIFINIE